MAALETVALLADPLRRLLYEHVRRQDAWVTRDQAAEAAGIARHLASFHLDRLHEAGLLEVEFRRPPGKAGPGAGRPAKHYRAVMRDVEASLPPRRYAFAGSLLARAIGRAGGNATGVREALRDVAREAGRDLAREARGAVAGSQAPSELVAAVLEELGYEAEFEAGAVSLSNCPFRALAEEDTDLVCGMNLDLLSGLVEGLSLEGAEVRLQPAPGRCCVTMSLP